jgi:hypothetical protein
LTDVSILTTPSGEIRAERESSDDGFGVSAFDVAFEGDSSVISGLSGSFAMSDVCQTLEHALGQIVLDETHLTGTYRIDLRVAAPATIVDGLREIGLDVTPARREIEGLVVKRRSGSGSGF